MAESGVTAWIRKTLTKEVVLAFLLGAFVGLVVLGWWLWPVQWTNADPSDLRSNHKDAYLQTVADSYALTRDTATARARLQSVLAPGEGDRELAARINALVASRLEAGKADEALRLQGLAAAVVQPAPSPTATPQPAGAASRILRIAGVVFFLALLAAGVLLLLNQLQQREAVRRRRMPSADEAAVTQEGEEANRLIPPTAAITRLQTAYRLGDEDYDESTSVHSAAGEFIGECGVSGLVEAGFDKGPGLAGFELWLFDKDDVRTETKVLLSEQVYADTELRERVAHKGEPVVPVAGNVLTLQTANLRLEATITALEYADESHSSFARLNAVLEVGPR